VKNAGVQRQSFDQSDPELHIGKPPMLRNATSQSELMLKDMYVKISSWHHID